MSVAPARTVLELMEYVTRSFGQHELPPDLGELLWREYDKRWHVLRVDFPTPATSNYWELTALGWVGHIPLTPSFGLALQPKVPLRNLFGMLEYAYRLASFHFLDGVVDCDSLQDYYQQLAKVLASRVLDRGRKGFYRAYLPETERLPYVRGRMDVRHSIQRPWDVHLRCHYEEHTADIEENQLLAWTLLRVARSGMCTERVLPTVRRAYRALHGLATAQPFTPRDCVGRLYNRLNDDYHPLHALCRFFLAQTGPSHELGDAEVLPFLVDMARLYELFVAEWLRTHPPPGVYLRAPETVLVGGADLISFEIDLVLYDSDTDRALCVLDTKYKNPDKPSSADVSQVVTYAELKGCTDAILVYPEPLPKPLDHSVGNIRVQSMSFMLDGSLEAAGQSLVHSLSASGVLN